MFPAFSQVFTAENMLYLFRGALLSLLIAAISLLIGLLLGILGASGKRSKHAVPKAIANFYVEVIRGTPLLLQILIIFSVINLYRFYRKCFANQCVYDWCHCDVYQ